MAIPKPSLLQLNLDHTTANISSLSLQRNVVDFRKSSLKPSKFRLSVRTEVAVDSTDMSSNKNLNMTIDLLACPICYEPLIRKGPPGLNLSSIYRSGFQCQKCKKAYSSRDVYLDLTITADSSEYIEPKPVRTELFRSPLVSFVYERGWRQNFARRGFPGPDEEFKMAQKRLKAAEGGLLVDVSCGSGLFSRRFAKCGYYSGVVALDFSENMLRQCYEFVKQDRSLSTMNLALVRADVARLPFATSSVDAVHAGAALHCWPSLSSAVAEISRILRPGGVFVATTFLASSFVNSLVPDMLKPFRQAVRQATSSYTYLTEKELEDLCKSCGFVDYSSTTKQSFIMLSARKPE